MSKYKKEMRGYADLYAAIFRASSEEGYRKCNQLFDSTLKGKWLSMNTVVRTEQLKRDDGSSLRVLIAVRRNHQNHQCTGLLWLHGGGYAMGLPELETAYVNLFAEQDDCVIILPDYTRSVDAPYPAALQDAYLTLVWMKEHAEELDIRSDQLFVGGESAGGGLACALTLYARDMKEVKIAFQMPLYPMLDDRMTETSSHNTSAVWNTEKNLAAWRIYRGENKETSPYFAPAREKDYHDLPPAFSIITDTEPFYAETKTYFHHLYEAGTEIMLKEYPGCFHAFDTACPNTSDEKHARSLEQKVFRYAQKRFFASQPSVTDAEEMVQDEADIENIIQDIETQHDLLDAAKKDPASSVPEVTPIVEESSEQEPDQTAAATERVPEVDAVEEEAQPSEKILEEASAEETADQAEPVEERPLEENGSIAFPSFPSQSEPVTTEDEITTITNMLQDVEQKMPPAFPEETETAVPAEEPVPEVEADADEPTAESFTREDVMKLLQKKEQKRQGDVRPYLNENGKEDILSNVQKIIEEDANSTLEEINDLVEKL